MSIFDTFTAPQTFQLPVEEVLKFSRDGRRVLPSYRAIDYPIAQFNAERMERYFQVKPDVQQPKLLRPNGAIATIVLATLIGMIGLFGAHSFLIFFLALIGVAVGWYIAYKHYEPARIYLYPLEAYLLREAPSYASFENWRNERGLEMFKTTASRLNLDLSDLIDTGTDKAVLGDPRLIMGYFPQDDVIPVWNIKLHPVQPTLNSPPLINLYRQLAQTSQQLEKSLDAYNSKLRIADHVEYPGVDEHWRVIENLLVIPLTEALAVYKTSIDAIDLKRIDDVTSEYFYQSVIGLETKVFGRTDFTRNYTTFTLLIGGGVGSPSISTIQPLNDTIKLLRETINDKKVRALRQEAASGIRVVPPTKEEMRFYAMENAVG